MLFFFATLTNEKNVESKKAKLREIESRIISSKSLEGWRGEDLVQESKATAKQNKSNIPYTTVYRSDCIHMYCNPDSPKQLKDRILNIVIMKK